MSVSIKAVRETYGFVDGVPSSLRQALSRGFANASPAKEKETDTIELTLGAKRRSERSGDSSKTQSAALDGEGKTSGLRGLLGEIQTFAAQLEELEARAALAPPGSEQGSALANELEAQRSAYSQLLESPVFERLEEIMKHVERMFSQGASSQVVARALSRERGLLGDDLLGVIQGGDLSSLSSIRGVMDGLRGVDVASGSASVQLRQFANQLFNALAGKTYEEKTPAPKVMPTQEAPLKAPELKRLDMDLPGDLSFALITVTGKDVAKAIESHSLPDPRYALVLVADTDRKVESEIERRKREYEEEEERERERIAKEKLSIASMTDSDE